MADVVMHVTKESTIRGIAEVTLPAGLFPSGVPPTVASFVAIYIGFRCEVGVAI